MPRHASSLFEGSPFAGPPWPHGSRGIATRAARRAQYPGTPPRTGAHGGLLSAVQGRALREECIR